jgi:hypothetical protein
MAITPQVVREVVSREDNFGHEMRVGNILAQYPAIELLHGGTYVDTVSKKPRQFDFRWVSKESNCLLALAIECKNINPETPIAVCGTKRSETESFHMFIESRAIQERITGPSSRILKVIGTDSLYRPTYFVGKSVLPVKPNIKRDVDSDIYDRWAQALSSAVDLVRAAHEYAVQFKADNARLLPLLFLASNKALPVSPERPTDRMAASSSI